MRDAVARRRHATGLAGRALDQAVRELLLLESSDWAFMLRRGEMTPYAEARVRAHASRAAAGSRASRWRAGERPEDAAWVEAVCDWDCFLAGLPGSGSAMRLM